MSIVLWSRLELLEKEALLDVLFYRVVSFKYGIEDDDFLACIKDALVDACDQIEDDLMPRSWTRKEAGRKGECKGADRRCFRVARHGGPRWVGVACPS